VIQNSTSSLEQPAITAPASWVSRALERLRRDITNPLKTGVAAALSLVVYQALHLHHGYWVVISAIIVMQSNLGRSIGAGASRLVGTAIGALIGAVVFRLAGHNFAALFLATVLTMLICSLVGLKQSQRLAGVTVAIVMLLGEPSAWHAGADRFMEVALGIVVALAVSLLWPSRARHALRKSLVQTYTDLRALFAMVMAGVEGQGDAEAIERAIGAAKARSRRNGELLADVQREPGDTDAMLEHLHRSAERTREHIVGINYSARAMAQDSLHRTMERSLADVVSAIDGAMRGIVDDLCDHPGVAVPPLQAVLEQLDGDLASARQSRATLAYSGDELLRFYSFLYRLQQLLGELIRGLEAANVLDHEK
jgi:uncharacterized membrane protein YccC